MKAIIFFTCFVLALNGYAQAAKCEIEGWKDENYGTYTFKVPINDTYRGVVATFTTKNILRMKVSKVDYLNATWEDQTLTFFTSDNFENYEMEAENTRSPRISVVIKSLCTEDTTQEMTFILPIVDNNNHSPIPSRKHYNYIFGMTVPKALTLTDLLPIMATEYDISDAGVYFTIEENDYFKIENKGKKIAYEKNFKTTLTAQTEIAAPFNHTFTLVVRDDEFPIRNVNVPLTITVATPEELEKNQQKTAEEVRPKQEAMVHPPIFEKHVYFADYSASHEFNLEELIVIKYGAESSTQLKQKGYEKYFKVQFEDGNHERITVIKLTSLPNELIRSTNIIAIEIEAVNQGLNLPGRTALLIRLPNLARNSGATSAGNSKECDLTVNYGGSSATLPLVLFLLAVFCIVFINIYMSIMFVNRNKMRFQTA